DSTGHGVPGAMVSVVCSNALNRAVLEFKLIQTGQILDKTRELVLETFSKSTTDVKDGMDISLLAVIRKNNEIVEINWSGANNPLWFIENNEVKEVKANKQPIGKTDNPTPFTTHSIPYVKGTSFYLFTDGYADQFGGPKGKKFKYKQLEELLLELSTKEMSVQKETLNSKFEEWKSGIEQVDDVCVIGIKL
ncbi:MAG: PP2C family protein-serine/threonine phosphatase, partial [Bacteroidia bacterium]